MLPYGRHSLHVRKITRQEGVGKVEKFKVGKSTKYRWNSAIECITIKINEVQILEVFKVFIVESSSEKCKGDVKVDKEIWKTRNIAGEACAATIRSTADSASTASQVGKTTMKSTKT